MGPPKLAPYCVSSDSALTPPSSNTLLERHGVRVWSRKKLPSNSLLPERVTATTAALLSWSNSAL